MGKLSWTENLILKEDKIYPESCDFGESPVMVFNVTKPPGITIWTNSGSRCSDTMDDGSKTRRFIIFVLGVIVISVIFFWGMWVREEHKWRNKLNRLSVGFKFCAELSFRFMLGCFKIVGTFSFRALMILYNKEDDEGMRCLW